MNLFRAFGATETRGILVRGDAEERVVLNRIEPPADLADILERFWIVRWDLTGRPAREQEVLPFPCVNMVFGTHRTGVHGPQTQRFVTRLSGRGGVFGLKFRPAGFYALLRAGLTAQSLVDRPMTVAEALATPPPELLDAESACAFLRARHPGLSDDDRRCNAIVEEAKNDPSITRVAELSRRTGRSVRALERLFRARIGVSPKWVIRRFRVQEAALRIASGQVHALADLAHALGYCDQSHFIHDFQSQVGRTPAKYLTACRQG